MSAAMPTPATFAIAAVCVALTWLLAEQGMMRCKALRDVAGSPRRLARLLIGALLLGAMTGALLLLRDGAYRSVAWGIGFAIACAACAALLRSRQRGGWASLMPWLAAMLVPLFVALGCIGKDAPSGLLGGFALAFALGVGLPAFGVLARRLDDPDVPAMMRPLPARVLTACILALAMAGSLSW